MKTLAILVLLAAVTQLPRHSLAGDATTPPAARSQEVVVYKSPWCGCCEGWTEHMRSSGFHVETHEMEDLSAVKRMAGVPKNLQSCHTAFVGGYAVEGHVPADVISRVLAERPEVQGVAVPGMPVGSPGMEGPDPESYDVMTFTKDGSSEVYTRVEND